MAVDEFKLRRDAEKASRAKNLLDSELLQEAFKTLENAYVGAWRTTSADNTIGREKLFLAINVVGKVKEHLDQIVTNGKLATAELAALAEEVERRKRRLGIF